MNNIIAEAITEVLDTPSLRDATNTMRLDALLARLVQDLPSEEGYLEVGEVDVGYFESALQGEKAVRAYAAITEPIKDTEPLTFKKSVADHGAKHPDCKFFDGEFFRVIADKNPFPTTVGIYFYAGRAFHSRLLAAVSRAEHFLARQTILICDKWKLPGVRSGTWDGLSKLNPWKVTFQELRGGAQDDPEGFGEGIGIFHLDLF